MVYNIPSVKALEKKMKPPCLPHIPPEWKCFGVWKLKHIFKARTSQWDDNETTWRLASVEHSSVMHLMVNSQRLRESQQAHPQGMSTCKGETEAWTIYCSTVGTNGHTIPLGPDSPFYLHGGLGLYLEQKDISKPSFTCLQRTNSV